MFKALSRYALIPIASFFFLQPAFSYDCAKQNSAMAYAAHSGHLETLKKHKQNGCKFRNDERGFTLHDFAALTGDSKTQSWLAQQKMDTKPSAALIRLVQAGLRHLGHDAGPIDGKLNARTEKAILAYQKQHKIKQNKQLKSAWLAHFYKNLMKKTQSALIQKGYKLSKADGQFGKETRKALTDYRSKQKLSPKHYAYLDDTIVRHLLSGHNATTRPQKLATTKALAQNKAKSKVQSKSQNNTKQNQTASKPKSQPAAPKVPLARAVEEEPLNDGVQASGIRLVRSSETSTTPAQMPRLLVQPEKTNNTDKVINSDKTDVQSIRGNYRTIKGRLQISGGQCKIGGQNIDSSWCQSHQDRNGRSCSAVIDNKGKVYNLLCK